MAGTIKATKDKETKRQIRYKIEENKYGISGSLYVPKEMVKKSIPEGLKISVAFDRN